MAFDDHKKDYPQIHQNDECSQQDQDLFELCQAFAQNHACIFDCPKIIYTYLTQLNSYILYTKDRFNHDYIVEIRNKFHIVQTQFLVSHELKKLIEKYGKDTMAHIKDLNARLNSLYSQTDIKMVNKFPVLLTIKHIVGDDVNKYERLKHCIIENGYAVKIIGHEIEFFHPEEENQEMTNLMYNENDEEFNNNNDNNNADAPKTDVTSQKQT